MTFTYTWTNGLIAFENYLNGEMKGIAFTTTSDGVEFHEGISLNVVGNPEEGFRVIYKDTHENSSSQSKIEVSALGAVLESSLRVIINSGNIPLTSTSEGQTGEISSDENYIYRCVAPNTWKRSDLNTWVAESE